MNNDEINKGTNNDNPQNEGGGQEQLTDSGVTGVQEDNGTKVGAEVTQGGTPNTSEQGGKTENRYKYVDEKGEHLHLLDGKPLTGTSSVLSVVAKPLTWWAVGEGLKLLGWTPINDKKTKKKVPTENRLPEAQKSLIGLKDMKVDEYLALLDKAYYAHDKVKDKSAKQGTDLHAMLEGFVKAHMADILGTQDYKTPERIQEFAEWTAKNVKRFLWSEMYTFSEKEWLGGISDCGCELNDGRIAIIDFKSSREAYLSQYAQIAGYDIQISESGGYDKDGNKIFDLEGKKIDCYIVVPFGADKLEPQYYLSPWAMKEYFLSALKIYNLTPR